MFTYRVVIKRNNQFLVHDNPETGRWEFPGVRTDSSKKDVRLLKLQSFLVENNIAVIGLTPIYSDKSVILTRKGDKTPSNNQLFIADELVGGKPESKSWKFLSPSDMLRIGNLDGLTRRYLNDASGKKNASLTKYASGPSNDHRSVSAVLTKGNKVFVMEHPYQKIWSIPKGHIDGAETAREAIVRELDEELGIKPTDMEMLTWYVEDYRGKSSGKTRVKHYIYKVNSWDGDPVNKEYAKHGPITMKWMPMDKLGEHEDISLMTLKAVDQIRNSKKGGVGSFVKPAITAASVGLVLPGMMSLLLPRRRRAKLRELKNNFNYIADNNPVTNNDWMSSAKDFAGTASDFVTDIASKVPGALNSGYNQVAKVPGQVGNIFEKWNG